MTQRTLRDIKLPGRFAPRHPQSMELMGVVRRDLPVRLFGRSARGLAAIGAAGAGIVAVCENARSRGRFDRGFFE